MADDPVVQQPAPTPPPSGPPPQSMDSMVDPDKGTKDALIGLQKAKGGAEAGIAGQEARALTEDKARAQRAYDAEGVTIDEIGKQSWNADQELQKREHSPMENFGSLGSIIAIAASAFTHTSAISAFNAAAAYNEAVKNNDKDAYDKAFDGFKENANLMIKRAGLEHERYEDAFKMAGMDMNIANARARAAAASFADKKALILMDAGMFPELMQAKASMFDATAKIQDDLTKIERNKAMLDFVYEQSVIRDEKGEPKKDPKTGQVQYDPKKHSDAVIEFERRESEAKWAGHGARGSGTPTQEKEIWRRVEEKHAADPSRSIDELYDESAREVKAAHATPLSVKDQAAIVGHIGQYDDAVKIIDGIEKTLETHVGSAGVAGKATRMKERVSNILGGNETDRVQMMRDIEQLRLMAPRLLLDQKTGRPLSVEAGHINSVIAGLDMGDTTANTLRAMREIRTRLKELRDRNAKELGGAMFGGGADVSPPPAEPKHNWDEFPDKQ